jgi:hypothetical protein
VTDVLKTYKQLTRKEFDRLLTECMDTYAEAVQAHFRNGADYNERLDKATQARAALTDAVFP